ncbi:MAG: hypothetical protein RL346_366 [Verrucomicrobiota bacterium]
MMIYRHRIESGSHPPIDSKPPLGFTLLEIVIVLVIAALVIGGSITSLMLQDSERILRNQSGEIELLAKKARTSAILHQIPYAIEFHPDSITLLPLSESIESRKTTALGREIGGSGHTSTSARTSQTLSLEPNLLISIRRWNTTEFMTPKQSIIPVWRFDPDGLCEPITVRLSLDESYAQDTYHPLTATITDSELQSY